MTHKSGIILVKNNANMQYFTVILMGSVKKGLKILNLSKNLYFDVKNKIHRRKKRNFTYIFHVKRGKRKYLT